MGSHETLPVDADRRRRRGPLVAAACVTVLGLVIGTVAVLRPGPVEGWLGGGQPSPTPVAEVAIVPPSPVLAAVSQGAPAPSAAGVTAALEPLLADARLGTRVAASVVDVETGQSLYARGPDNPALPASTTKLVTALTVLTARSPAYRIATRAVAGANPGEVVLVGGGDATLAAGATGSYPGAARLDLLADAVKRSGVTPTRVIFDSSLFPGPVYGPGWDAETPTEGYGGAITALMTDGGRVDPARIKTPSARYRSPDLAAAQAFARSFGLPTSAVVAGVAPTPGTNGASHIPSASPSSAPTPGTELGRVESPPMARLVDIMLTDSDNVLAEALARQVALAKGQPGSFAGASTAMNGVLAELGLPAGESRLVDGSGLSKTGRLTASLLTDLLVLAARPDRPQLHGIFSGLPVAGFSGTLKERYRSPGPTRPGAGVVRAKTGTLVGVNAISGIAITQEGRVLAFAILADRVTSGAVGAQDALDRITTTLAGCGCR